MLNFGIGHLDSDMEVRGKFIVIGVLLNFNNDLDARGVVLNLASFISASIWKSEEKVTVRGLILNLTAIWLLLEV